MQPHPRICIKVRLKNILEDVNIVDYSKLTNAITNSNALINNGCLFMRSFILYIIENNNDNNKLKIIEPIINIDFIRLAFSVISNDNTPKKGAPFSKEKQVNLEILQKFFTNIFCNETKMDIINATNLSYILGQSYEQIYITIIINIICFKIFP